MQKKSKLAVVVPCYNEENCIPVFFEELASFESYFATNCPDTQLTFYFVDNNSTDSSLSRLQQFKSGERHVLSCVDQGYGAALKYGFSRTESADWIAFLDLDNTYPQNCLVEMLQKLRQENLDMVYGARIHHKSKISAVRGLGNKFYVLLSFMLLGSKLSDVCSGMRIFKSSRLPEILSLKTSGLSFSIDFSAHALTSGWRLGELPIDYRHRIGESKLSVLYDGFSFLFALLSKYFQSRVKN